MMTPIPALPISISQIWYKEVGRDYDIAPHTLKVCQWYYVLHGRVRSAIDGQEFLMGPDESTIVLPDVVRDRCYAGRAPGYMVVEFENHGIDLTSVAHRLLATPAELRYDLHVLIDELRNPQAADSKACIYSLVTRLLIGLKRFHQDASPVTPTPSLLNADYHAELADRIERYLAHNFRNEVTRATIASALGRSAVHLARVYRATTGKTIGARLREVRIEYARELLLDSTMPITTIALEVGFTSFSHFAAIFRRTVGVTPSDYRRSGGTAWTQPTGCP